MVKLKLAHVVAAAVASRVFSKAYHQLRGCVERFGLFRYVDVTPQSLIITVALRGGLEMHSMIDLKSVRVERRQIEGNCVGGKCD